MAKKNLLQLLVGFLTVVLLVAGCTSRDRPDTEADTTAINTIWSKYESSLEAGDIDAWLSLWTEKGIQMPPGEAPVVGMDQLRARNGAALDKFTVDMEISNAEVEIFDGWAFSRGTYTATFSPKDGSQPIPVDGKYMTILEKQSGGEWKIYRDIFNSNVTPGGE